MKKTLLAAALTLVSLMITVGCAATPPRPTLQERLSQIDSMVGISKENAFMLKQNAIAEEAEYRQEQVLLDMERRRKAYEIGQALQKLGADVSRAGNK